MPSQAIKPTSLGMTGIRNNDTWTDGLPICKLSGVGMSANQMYREDGTPCSEHEYEDRSIHFCLDHENGTYLYGVFDGHDGAKAAYFASQRMPAELSFEQLTGKTTEEEVKEVFRDAFLAVENAFLESIDPKIAERTQLLDKIPDGMSQFEAAQKYPETVNRLQALDQEIRGGTTAVVALIHGGMLYVGNVGDSRALLCKKDRSGVLKVKQLTADHTTSSHDEVQRLAALNLPPSKIQGAKLGNHELTRCIGSYFMKGGCKEFDILSSATAEPVIAEPHITSLPIDESCSFLLLMSDGLYKSYQDSTGSEQVNKEIAQMVVEQFVEQPTLTSVAQTVVDKVVRLHHDNYLTKQRNVTTRDDISLIIRNFNFPLRGALTPSSAFPGGLSPRPPLRHLPCPRPQDCPSSSTSSSGSDDMTLREESDVLSGLPDSCMLPGSRGHRLDFPEGISNSVDDHGLIHHTDTNTTSTESSELQNPSLTQFSLDEDGRIHPYVNFDQYYQAVEEARAAGIITESQLHLYK
ncbi:TGF-beta-activated kinase 1 and MAP3K7-binding protein 1-like isoform X1 [Panulirus ornatus]|uniref:TGF-beta-activated kinase 1 and MAP3K7-binding protein 1-like isoform X1 n=1 Tax=Panulirus ornatus TaxID=150431 RepID=UPI003A859372